MRFSRTKEFDVSDLWLDEDNYRFHKADDQKACIVKIYQNNTNFFRGLMESIAKYDLGELLLVYEDNGQNIVMDGNRRLAAIKVLSDDDFAPTPSIAQYARELRSEFNPKLTDIMAQVSCDKEKIMLTVFERHAGAGTGTARVKWDAFASALFNYNEKIDEKDEWKYISLLLSSIGESGKYYDLVFGEDAKFKYDIFRRVIKAAIRNGVISDSIFSKRGQRIKKTAPEELVKDGIQKCEIIVEDICASELSFSRQNFADAARISEYLDKFVPSPEVEKASGHGGGGKSDSEGEETEVSNGQEGRGNSDTQQTDDHQDQAMAGASVQGSNNGVPKSDNIEIALKNLGDPKLIDLYKSLYVVSAAQHPQLLYVGAWTFLEILKEYHFEGKNNFAGLLKNFASQELGWDKPTKEPSAIALNDIHQKGNATKHNKNYAPPTAKDLQYYFGNLEELIIEIIKNIKN